MIRLNELHFQLMQDPFYGYEQIPNTWSTSWCRVPCGPHRLIERAYTQLANKPRAAAMRNAYAGRWFNDDKLRELITLWCAFFGLSVYLKDKVLDWDWREFVDHGLDGLRVKDEDLKSLLRERHLPLPVYFFPDEPDNSKNPATVNEAIAAVVYEDTGRLASTELRKRTIEIRNQRWQARIDELAALPEHQGKTHAQLCRIVEGELIAGGKSTNTIERATHSPFGNKTT